MRSIALSLVSVLALLMQPLVADALIRVWAYADASFTVNLPGGTHMLIEEGGHYDIVTEADLNSWTVWNGATCYVDAPAGIPTGVVGFEMIYDDQFLYPCGWQSSVRVVCTGPESKCTL